MQLISCFLRASLVLSVPLGSALLGTLTKEARRTQSRHEGLINLGERPSFKQAVHVEFRIKDDEIVNLFSYSSIANRQTQFIRNGNRDSTLCGTVEFRQYDPGDTSYLEKLPRLLETVLA